MSELLTVRDVATVLKCGEDAVVRRFARCRESLTSESPRPGVGGGTASCESKTVVEKYLAGKSGQPVQIEVPERAERRRKSATWENRAILNLAKAALQNECQDRKAYRRIADRARLLTVHVPEDRWPEIVWFDDED